MNAVRVTIIISCCSLTSEYSIPSMHPSGPLQFVETTVTRLPTTIVSTTTSTITIAGTVGFLAGLHVVVLTIILVLSALCIRRRRSRKAHGGNDSLGAANHQMTTSWTSSGCNDQIVREYCVCLSIYHKLNVLHKCCKHECTLHCLDKRYFDKTIEYSGKSSRVLIFTLFRGSK